MVKNPPSNAGDTGSIPGQGAKIPHEGWGGTTKPVGSRARAPQLERSPHAARKDPACHS